MRVLVCGGRDYNWYRRIWEHLDAIHAKTPITCIIEGGAKGADHGAFLWAARGNQCMSQTFQADWDSLGKAAGVIRNQRMLDEGKPDLVLAFPGGKGTADMVERAKRRGIPVREVQ